MKRLPKIYGWVPYRGGAYRRVALGKEFSYVSIRFPDGGYDTALTVSVARRRIAQYKALPRLMG